MKRRWFEIKLFVLLNINKVFVFCCCLTPFQLQLIKYSESSVEITRNKWRKTEVNTSELNYEYEQRPGGWWENRQLRRDRNWNRQTDLMDKTASDGENDGVTDRKCIACWDSLRGTVWRTCCPPSWGSDASEITHPRGVFGACLRSFSFHSRKRNKSDFCFDFNVFFFAVFFISVQCVCVKYLS